MDAVTKAAEALRDGVNIRELINERYAEEIAEYVLDAVGYPAHQSSDEGTCWCPVAEQAGRERDALRAQSDGLARENEGLIEIVAETESVLARFGMDIPPVVAAIMAERDALRAERDRYKAALKTISGRAGAPASAFNSIARAALVKHLEAEGPHRPCVHGRCGES